PSKSGHRSGSQSRAPVVCARNKALPCLFRLENGSAPIGNSFARLKRWRNFHLLSRCGHEVFALRPDLVVEQELELKLLLAFAGPFPRLAIHARERNALRP